MKLFVYKISNTVNDKIYIGLTTCSIKKRWREHLSAANRGCENPLYRAMRKHGIENFNIEAIYQTVDVQDLRTAEVELISTYKSHVSANGYNLTDYGIEFGDINKARGEVSWRSMLTDEIVKTIRDPKTAHITNQGMTNLICERFGKIVSRDCVRDARRGDSWTHLNDVAPPLPKRQGGRQTFTKEAKQRSIAALKQHHSEAVKKSADMRRGQRGLNAKVSEEDVIAIFKSPLSLTKTAEKFGISVATVKTIKYRKFHKQITKDL